jgi:ferric iron reductase protein FhuF
MKFLEELKMQRWDDHRYYHQSRINQSLHLLSSMSFLGAYVLLFINPVLAAFLGWFVAMVPRQVGHFFFEPKEYDEVNHATHKFKESIKVGYNLRRKVVLLSIWALSPVALYYYPTMFGFFEAYVDLTGYLNHLGMMWLVLGIGALLFRTVHLFYIQNVQAGLVWFTKILTDPFHDIKIYHKSPFYLLKGELLDPMHHVE